MKVLLINPPADLKRTYGSVVAKFQVASEPIGLAYIVSYLEKYGVDVNLKDAYALQLGLNEILNLIKEDRPRVVGLSCLTPNAHIVYQIAKEIKANFSDVIIIMGNTHSSIFAGDILAGGLADVIIHGEGEETTLETIMSIMKWF